MSNNNNNKTKIKVKLTEGQLQMFSEMAYNDVQVIKFEDFKNELDPFIVGILKEPIGYKMGSDFFEVNYGLNKLELILQLEKVGLLSRVVTPHNKELSKSKIKFVYNKENDYQKKRNLFNKLENEFKMQMVEGKNSPYTTNVSFDKGIYLTRNGGKMIPLSQGAVDNVVKYHPIKEEVGDQLELSYLDNIKDELRKLFKNTVYDETGTIERRIEQLLDLHKVWLSKAIVVYDAKTIADKLFQYEKNGFSNKPSGLNESTLPNEPKERRELASVGLRQKGDLPNKEGFKFIAVYNDGTQKVQTIKKDEKGLHYMDGFKDIKGWKPVGVNEAVISNLDEKIIKEFVIKVVSDKEPKLLKEELNKGDVVSEIEKFLTSTKALNLIKKEIMKDLVDAKDLENKMVEVASNVLVQLYKSLWTKRGFWKGDLKNNPA